MSPTQFRKAMCAVAASMVSGERVRTPAGGNLMVKWFGDLARCRSWHASGANPIDDCQIADYARNMRIPLEPRHIELLKAMDGAFIEAISERRKITSKPGAGAPMKTKEITPAIFDAMFG